nr:MAG TPA: hypothetical protein [Caudoviricetes sp.]
MPSPVIGTITKTALVYFSGKTILLLCSPVYPHCSGE